MSINLNINLFGSDELKKAFAASPKIVQDHMRKVVATIAYNVEGKAKINAPHQTSALRGSIHTEGPKVGTGGDIEARVGTNLRYAPYQEYGTGVYAEPPEGFSARRQPITPKKARVLAFKVGGKTVFARSVRGVKPKKYFQRAKKDTLPLVDSVLKEGLKDITEELTA